MAASNGIGLVGGGFQSGRPSSLGLPTPGAGTGFVVPGSIIIDEIFWTGMTEVLEANTNVFNEASAGALRLSSYHLKGHFERQQFMKSTAIGSGVLGQGLIQPRDINSMSPVNPMYLSMGEQVSVKLNRRFGPLAYALDLFEKHMMTQEEYSYMAGEQWGCEIAKDYVDTGLLALTAAIAAGNQEVSGSTVHDLSTIGNGKINYNELSESFRKLGDASGRIVAFVMHSKVYVDLMQQAMADKIYEVSGVTIYSGTVASLNRPVIVIDSPALVSGTGASTLYTTLALTDSALEVVESEERKIIALPQALMQNLSVVIQGEYAFNVKVKGYTYTGEANPNSTILHTTSNWASCLQDVKSRAGVVLLSK